MVKTIWQKLKAERQTDTQTLWNNEVSANIFLAKTMLATALLALIFILLSLFNIIWCNNTTLLFLGIAIFVLVFPAVTLSVLSIRVIRNGLNLYCSLSTVLSLP